MRGYSIGEGASSTTSTKRLADVQRGTCCCGLLATQLLAAFIINIRSFLIKVLNAICLNSSSESNPLKAVDAGVNKIRVRFRYINYIYGEQGNISLSLPLSVTVANRSTSR